MAREHEDVGLAHPLGDLRRHCEPRKRTCRARPAPRSGRSQLALARDVQRTEVERGDRVQQVRVALLLVQRGDVEQPQRPAAHAAPGWKIDGVDDVRHDAVAAARLDLLELAPQILADRRDEVGVAEAKRASRRSKPVTSPRWKPV